MWVTICRPAVSAARRVARHIVLHPVRTAVITAPAFGSLAWLLMPPPPPSPPINPNCGCREVWVSNDAVEAAYERYYGQPYPQSPGAAYSGLSSPALNASDGFVETLSSDSDTTDSFTVASVANAAVFAEPPHPVQVPEPQSILLFGTGLMMLCGVLQVRWMKPPAAAPFRG